MTIFEFAAAARRTAVRAFVVAGLVAVATVPFAASAQDLKIGVVDFRRLIDEAPQSEEVQKKLETEFNPRQAQLLSMTSDFEKRRETFLRDSAVMGADEREKLERELRDMQRDVERSQTQFMEDLNVRRNEELQRLQNTLVTRVRAYAEAEDYDLIVADAVYFSDAIDITDDVLAALKK
jgi:outer membrane protein